MDDVTIRFGFGHLNYFTYYTGYDSVILLDASKSFVTRIYANPICMYIFRSSRGAFHIPLEQFLQGDEDFRLRYVGLEDLYISQI
jgi:hypothetical protein